SWCRSRGPPPSGRAWRPPWPRGPDRRRQGVAEVAHHTTFPALGHLLHGVDQLGDDFSGLGVVQSSGGLLQGLARRPRVVVPFVLPERPGEVLDDAAGVSRREPADDL